MPDISSRLVELDLSRISDYSICCICHSSQLDMFVSVSALIQEASQLWMVGGDSSVFNLVGRNTSSNTLEKTLKERDHRLVELRF